MDRVQGLLEELTNAYGPSGFEGPVRSIVERELKPICNELKTDGIGSLISRLEGKSETPRIMLAGHMDELGLMVKFITPEGFIKFQTIGGWLDQSLINQRWKILTNNGPILGVTGIKTVHVMEPEARQRVFKRQDMFIDVGATDQKDAESRLGIRPGDPIAPDSKFTILSGGNLYLAKAWDDRIGVALVIEIMRTLKKKSTPNTVYGVATVQEEIGLRGAHTSSYQVAPDIGISLESGVASDYPGITKDEAQEKLGDGPSIFLHDNSMLPNLKLRDLFLEVAAENKIPLQFNVLSGYGEDGAEMQRTRGGAPSINIAVPTRYLHSHNGIINRRDFDYAVDLVSSVIFKLDAKTVDYLKAFD